ncbi:MAG: DNA polymerase I [Alphaproteobacteria bacterium]
MVESNSPEPNSPDGVAGAPPLRHVYLVDGSGYIFRAFHALPPMTRPDGTPVNAVYGFTSMLLKLRDDSEADCIAVLFDTSRKTFRNDIYPEYKAHRPDAPEDLIPQFALIREATRALNLPAIEMPGYEADDLIATYATQAAARGAEVTIVSSDKDLMQLVTDRVALFDPVKNRKIDADSVIERFGVGPDKVVEVQALAGDSSDNVPGVPGIGVKTAAELIKEYGDLDTLLARAGEIKQPKRRETLTMNADMARLSRELVRLKTDVPVEHPLDDFRTRAIDGAVLGAFLKEQGFKSLLARMVGRFSGTASPVRESDAAPGGHDSLVTRAAGPAIPAGNVEKITATRYESVQSTDALKRWIARARDAGTFAFDIETTSLDAMRARLVGVSMAIVPGEACYVPLGHGTDQGELGLAAGASKPEQIPLEEALALLRPLLADESVLKIGHNIKYDMLVLSRAPYDAPIRPVDDSMLLSYVLEAGAHGHGMDELAKLHLDHDTIKFEDVAGAGKARITFDRVPLEKALAYAAEDADVTLRLYNALKPRLLAEKKVTLHETEERPLIPILVAMERAGIKVDVTELKRLSVDFAERLATFEIEIHKLAGETFNIASPKQLGEVLFDKLSLPGGAKSAKTGAYGTGADVLEDLAAQGHDLPARVLDWRQLAKLKSTYADALVEQINPDTGRVHTSYAMAIASTGRLSSTDPNLQNIPVRTEEGRKIRRAFVAERGMKLVSLDYSQIELRLLADVADIGSLKDAFRQGIDIHALTASQVFGEAVEGMSAETRRRAKAINFGIIYGISAFGLARQLGIAQGEAKRYIDAYFERYPGIRGYMDTMRERARTRGYVETLFGRRIHLAGIADKNPARRNFAERQAINAPLQGAAADIIKRAMVRVPAALERENLKGRMLLQVHDELLFEVPEGEVDRTIGAMTRVMAGAAHLSVPLVVDAGVADNWADAH